MPSGYIVRLFPIYHRRNALPSRLNSSEPSRVSRLISLKDMAVIITEIRFASVYIARGSVEETFTFLTLAHRLGYLPDAPYQQSMQAVERLKQMLNGYIRYLRQQQNHTK